LAFFPDEDLNDEYDDYNNDLDDHDEELDDHGEDLGDDNDDSDHLLTLRPDTPDLQGGCPPTGAVVTDHALPSASVSDESAVAKLPARKPLILRAADDDEDFLVPPVWFSQPTKIIPSASSNSAHTEAATATEANTLNKVISPDDEAKAEAELKQEILLLDTQGLIARGIEAVSGFRLSRLEKAMILAAAKERYSKGGAPGRRPAGEMTWAGYCEAVGEPLASADSLVKSYNRYLQLCPTLRDAARREGIEFKPKVMKVLQAVDEEVWSLPEDASAEHIGRWLELLRAAEGRANTLPTPSNAGPDSRSPSAVTAPQQDPGRRHGRQRNVSDGTGGKIITLDASGLKRLDEDIAKIRVHTGWAAGTVPESEAIARSIGMLAARLEVEHENANPRG
jgi:hypothetical protein